MLLFYFLIENNPKRYRRYRALSYHDRNIIYSVIVLLEWYPIWALLIYLAIKGV